MDEEVLGQIVYLIGDANIISNMPRVPALLPFSEIVLNFLADVSKAILSDKRNRIYPDVVTFAFWIRSASTNKLKERFKMGGIRMGRGIAFHIAPSNVPVNFAYSLVSGLLMGNLNIVRVPGRSFEQVSIIVDTMKNVLIEHCDMRPYIALIQYGHEKKINDMLSGLADIRIIWGGDATIAELRQSPLPPRSTEVLFADRYSLAVIDSDLYMGIENKRSIVEGFYNDTYLTDQNACTSPRIIIWKGSKKSEAKEMFWDSLHDLVKKKYAYQDIQGVNKLTNSYLAAVTLDNVRIVSTEDNLITRVSVIKIGKKIVDLMGNSGFFFEYDCDDVMELIDICDNKRCQTVGVLGDKKWLMPLIERGVKGVDRITDIGHTMDFDLIWDGYDLTKVLTREISIN